MKLKLTTHFLTLFSVCASYAQPLILDKVIAVVVKNPLLLSEVETSLLQEKEKNSDTTNTRCKVFEDMLFPVSYTHLDVYNRQFLDLQGKQIKELDQFLICLPVEHFQKHLFLH